MTTNLIIGATSAIAEEVAKLWVTQNPADNFILVGRNTDKLTRISGDLKVRGAGNVEIHQVDLGYVESALACIEHILQISPSIDRVLLAHGSLPDQNICASNTSKTIDEFTLNGVSFIAILNELAIKMTTFGHGRIGVITSVAGDRGRKSNYLYGSAKAAVTTFANGLRIALQGSGVSITIIKPGFVDTPMTANMKKGILWAQPETVAKKIVAAMENKQGNVYIPGFWMPIMFIIKHIPDFIFKRLPL